MKHYTKLSLSLILFLIVFIPIHVFAGAQANGEQAAKNIQCHKVDISSSNDNTNKNNCENAGCVYHSGDWTRGISAYCMAPECDELSDRTNCSSHNNKSIQYCTYSTYEKKCVKKDTCNDINHSRAFDDYGNECDYTKTESIGDNRALIPASYNNIKSQADLATVCKTAFHYKDQKMSAVDAEAYANEVCKGSYLVAYSGSVANCKATAKNATYNDYYNRFCKGTSSCPDGKISYKIVADVVGNTVQACTCPYGYTENAQGKCVANGSGGGTTCVPVKSYVESYNVGNVCIDEDSCEFADCSGRGDANPFENYYAYSTDVSGIAGISTGESYGSAFRYNGTCNNQSADVFCIDPSVSYRDNSANYTCKSSMNEESNIDSGFIKIYQLAVDKYSNAYNAGRRLEDDEYQGMHFAFRFWTFYSGMGRDVKGTYIDDAFGGTSRNIMTGTNSNSIYFMVKNMQGYLDVNSLAAGGVKEGYRDAVTFFKKTATGEATLWKNPLKFTLESIDVEKGTATVKLTNIQELRDVRFLNADGTPKFNFVKEIYCKEAGCSVSGLNPNIDYLRNGDNEVTFNVHFSGQGFTVGVKYYDKRDGKNVILATAGNAERYQRLLFVTSSINRTFIKEQYFSDTTGRSCKIIGGQYYDMSGQTTNLVGFLQDCCLKMKENPTLYRNFCNTVSGEDKNIMCSGDVHWLENGCKYVCAPEADKKDSNCDTMTGDDVVISDLTEASKAGLGIRYSTSDNYCLSCIGNGDLDSSGTPYYHEQKQYCDVYCFEEYKFNVPKHLGVNGSLKYGRYLELSVPANAKRICYTDTNTPIKTQQFQNDVRDLKKAIQDEIDELNKRINAYNEVVNNQGGIQNQGMGVCSESYTYMGCVNGSYGYSNGECKGTADSHGQCPGGYGSTVPGGTCYCPTEEKNGSRSCSNGAEPQKYWYTSSNGITMDSAGSCNGCSASNGSKEEVVNKFKNYRDEQKTKVANLISQYNAKIADYKSCYNVSGDSCISGDNGPYIEYKYEESYYMSLLGTNNTLKGSWSTTSQKTTYHDTVNTSLSNCTYSDNGQSNPTMADLGVREFRETNGTYVMQSGPINVPINKYVYYSENKSATLKPTATWYTKIGNGTATLKNEANTTYLGNVLPISRICLDSKETFKYEFKFKNLGQEPGSCTLGRLNRAIGTLNSTYINTDSKYVCYYDISNKGCEGCETTYFFRPVSLNDVFPKSGKGIEEASRYDSDYRPDTSVKQAKLTNERGAAPNWTTEKGKQTQKNIENLGDNTYTKEHLEYSYTITPAGMKQIRSYNSDKTYGDFTLTCNDQGDCTSTFLNEIEQNKYSGVKQNKRDPNLERFTDGSIWR